MNHPEHPAKTPSPRTGLFATLRAFLLGAKGTGAPPRVFVRRLLVTGALLALTAASAQAAEATIGSVGFGAGQLQGPRGVAVDSSGNLYTADAGNRRIDEFNPGGAFVKTFGKEVNQTAIETGGTEAEKNLCTAASGDVCKGGVGGGLASQFASPSSPQGVAVNSSGDVYAVDLRNHRIDEFNSAGGFVLTFGKEVNQTKHEAAAPEAEQNLCTAASGNVCEAGVSSSVPGIAGFSWANSLTGNFIAVDSSGNVWVGDVGRLEKFNSAGEYQSEIASIAGAPTALAADGSGNLYETSAGVPGVRKFVASTGTEVGSAFDAGGTPKALAIDASGDVYVADTSEGNHFLTFDPSGAHLSTFGIGAVAGGLSGIAVNHASPASVYASENAIGDVAVLPAPVPGPYVEPGSEFARLGTTAATMGATLNPEGNATSYRFQYVDAEHFENGGFSNPATQETPESASIGSDFSDHTITAVVSGLQPDTAYHYRVVATNSAGTVQGPGVTSTSTAVLAGPSNPACPNHAHVGLSARLPDCRAYELLTPPNKGDGEDMFGDLGQGAGQGGTFDVGVSSEDGDRFSLFTTSAFGPFAGAGQNTYLFSRSGAGWKATSLASPSLGAQSIVPELFSPDLSHFGVNDYVGSLGNVAATNYIGLLGAAGGPYTTAYNTPYGTGFSEFVGGSSDLGHVLLESSEHNLVPGSVAETQVEGSHTLYEYSNGHLSLADVKTNGELISPCGATSAVLFPIIDEGTDYHPVSSDGSRTFFLSPNANGQVQSADPSCYQENGSNPQEPYNWTGTPPQLYLRSGGVTTELSAPEVGVVDPQGPQPVAFVGAAVDGSRVFFITRTELTADDVGNHQPELYEYDVETEHVTRISKGESGTAVGNAGWVVPSADGSTVYFTATGQLAPGAPTISQEGGGSGEYNLYHYDTATSTTSYVATVSGHDWSANQAGGYTSLNIRFPINRSSNWETTSDGRYLLFDAVESLTAYDNEDPTGNCGGDISGSGGSGQACAEVYRYDAVTGSLLCLSCNPTGVAPDANALFDRSGHFRVSRAISETGSRVFFDTTEALVPTDTNGKIDVYEWHDGEISLISSGQDSSNSYFLESSADGSNVFFGTHSRLVAQDTDTSGDLYDARVEGGFPAPQGSVACEGDACQAPPAPPSDATPASETFHGIGNELFARHPKKPKHHKHHKTHKRSHKRADANRGGAK